MPLLGQLTAAIRGGVLLIGDDRVLEDGMGDDGPHPLLGVGPAQLVLSVEHGAEGDTAVRIASTAVDEPVGPSIFDGTVRISSGRLRVGDAVDEAVLWITVPPGDLRVRLCVSDADPDAYPPDRVDIVLPDI
ncbi:hypothetical protein KZ829_21815 [Actinoplanes hulinensis]|uniref:Uncharacterized protein n=1 Tax=Actinoplanes hulinensis TaxID=1144547 RepID=A0ABS7B5X7_9ACTN|nr:hypothetical protein [Actinoplanes hulinensis]MBW6436380.1 hypothetical protein [Actinoplanes hulinensis]